MKKPANGTTFTAVVSLYSNLMFFAFCAKAEEEMNNNMVNIFTNSFSKLHRYKFALRLYLRLLLCSQYRTMLTLLPDC